MNLDDVYGLEAGKPANFIILDAKSEFDAICERAGIIGSVRNGEYLFKKTPAVVEELVKLP
jgi:cytosine deaminase